MSALVDLKDSLGEGRPWAWLLGSGVHLPRSSEGLEEEVQVMSSDLGHVPGLFSLVLIDGSIVIPA